MDSIWKYKLKFVLMRSLEMLVPAVGAAKLQAAVFTLMLLLLAVGDHVVLQRPANTQIISFIPIQ